MISRRCHTQFARTHEADEATSQVESEHGNGSSNTDVRKHSHITQTALEMPCSSVCAYQLACFAEVPSTQASPCPSELPKLCGDSKYDLKRGGLGYPTRMARLNGEGPNARWCDKWVRIPRANSTSVHQHFVLSIFILSSNS